MINPLAIEIYSSLRIIRQRIISYMLLTERVDKYTLLNLYEVNIFAAFFVVFFLRSITRSDTSLVYKRLLLLGLVSPSRTELSFVHL